MTIDVDALKAGADIVSVVQAYVPLKKRGAEYVGLCPFHGEKTPSFWVIPSKQFCHCFGCGANHDVISFIQEIEGVDFKAACERLGAQTEWKPRAPIAQEAAPLPERITSKPPPDEPHPNMRLREIGEPSRVWTYNDADGSLIGFVARYDPSEGKQIRCWSWGARGDRAPSWGCGHWNKPRPLYGLDRLAARPEAPVMVVEGEKAADAAQALLPQYVVIAWAGGSQSWHKADLQPLAGRRVDLWPDNDEPGRECMAKLAGILADPRGLACHGKMIDPGGEPDGADAADWQGDDILAWLRARATDYTHTEPPTEPALQEAPETPPASEIVPKPPARKQKPRLAVVGNTALSLDPDTAPEAVPLSEDHLADHFAEQHHQDWRYVKRWDKWFRWDGCGWAEDDTAEAFDLARQICRAAAYWQEAVLLTPDGKRKLGRKATAGNVRDVAGTDRRIAATVDQWDLNPWLLGVPSGVVDLETGRACDARREDYITKRTAVDPERGAHPMWDKILARATRSDPTMAHYLQKWAGYMLTGDTREEAFLFVHGPGGSGKSTFVQVIRDVLGGYAKATRIETFMTSRATEHPTEIADLFGARLVYAPETEEGARWNESRIKMLTGRDKVKARFMNRDYFEFDPVCKIMIFGNHRPRMHSVGEEMRRRIHLVEFPDSIPAEERDGSLKERIRAEYPAILQWMIDGCLAWRSEGLGRPEAVSHATDEYLNSQDTLGAWLDECCERRTDARCQVSGAYRNFERWAKERGEYVPSTTVFSEKVQARGIEKRKLSVMYFIGIELKEAEQAPTPYYYQDR